VTASLSDHPHHHDHVRGHAHSDLPSDPALRTKALESLLVDKGLVDPTAIDAWIDAYESRIGPRRGAQIVARAWVDLHFKARLLQDATRTIEPFGFLGREAQHIVVVENTPAIHNLVVCTLCSCYPWGLLGLPPRWYKAAPYRARSVIDPRGVLAEFGLVLGEEVEVRVWDSTAEIRYLVLPERPAGTDSLSEVELAELVTRDAMIGVAKVEGPKGRAA
jgi:nitrile hydratase